MAFLLFGFSHLQGYQDSLFFTHFSLYHHATEIQTNVTYGALILNYSLDEIKTTAMQNGVNWESLPPDVQFGIAIANYNLSVGSGEAGKYIGPAMQACAGDLTWNCVSKKLVETGAPLTPGYADKAINYAQQGCKP